MIISCCRSASSPAAATTTAASSSRRSLLSCSIFYAPRANNNAATMTMTTATGWQSPSWFWASPFSTLVSSSTVSAATSAAEGSPAVSRLSSSSSSSMTLPVVTTRKYPYLSAPSLPPFSSLSLPSMTAQGRGTKFVHRWEKIQPHHHHYHSQPRRRQQQHETLSTLHSPFRYFSSTTGSVVEEEHRNNDNNHNVNDKEENSKNKNETNEPHFLRHRTPNKLTVAEQQDPLVAFQQRRQAAAAMAKSRQQQEQQYITNPGRSSQQGSSSTVSSSSRPWDKTFVSGRDRNETNGRNTTNDRHRTNNSRKWQRNDSSNTMITGSRYHPRLHDKEEGDQQGRSTNLSENGRFFDRRRRRSNLQHQQQQQNFRNDDGDKGRESTSSFFDRLNYRQGGDYNRRRPYDADRTANDTDSEGRSTNNRFGSSRNTATQGVSLLSDMIRQMKQDRSSSKSPGTSSSSSSDGQKTPRTSSWSNSFRRKADYREGTPVSEARHRSGSLSRKKQPRQPDEPLENFLSGRFSRSEEEESDIGTSENDDDDSVSTAKSVTLPAAALTLAETSLLFRIRVDDIEKKLVDIGLIPSPSISSYETTSADENDNDPLSPPPSTSTDDIMLDIEALELLGLEYGIETIRSTVDDIVFADSKRLLMQQRRTDENLSAGERSDLPSLRPRPPVVSVMGHVDHGKTTLMDALRRRSLEQYHRSKSKSKSKKSKQQKKSKKGSKSEDVAGTEAGGITQVISAFQVAVDGYDDMITFLDTPGHAAFSSMRQSGSHAADVIVLVIAADDGVSPQTVEILDMYKSIVQGSSEGGISMVVALNKIDKPGIDVDEAKMRIENQLLEHGIAAEGMNVGESEFGQPVQVIPTSGLTGLGLDDLTEGLMLQSEVMDLRADDQAPAEGIVMDSRVEKGLGVVADCIIRWGKIESGNFVLSGDQVARVRMLKDVNDKALKSGLPSQPVRIVGFKELPKAGDPLVVVASEEAGEEIIRQRLSLMSSSENSVSDRPEGDRSDVSLQIHGMRRGDSWRVKKVLTKAAIEENSDLTRIPIIVKANADGSLSAIRDSLIDLGDNSKSHSVVIDPISEGIGEITMSDIYMAKESDAVIFAFGLGRRIDQATLNLAESEGVTICSNDIIYALLDEAKDVLGSYLPPSPVKHVHGRALVQAVFTIDTPDGKEQVAGLKVTDGNIYKDKAKLQGGDAFHDCAFRVLRHGKQIAPDPDDKSAIIKALSLRKFKELVESVRMGEECGLALRGYSEFEDGDEVECFSIEMKPTKL